MQNETLLAFAAQVCRKGEPGAPVPALRNLPPVLLRAAPESHQQGRGTEHLIIMEVVSSCCPKVTVGTLCLSGAHSDIKQ